MHHGRPDQPFITAVRAVALDVVVFLRRVERETSPAVLTSELDALYV
jgi:hypothetical protein